MAIPRHTGGFSAERKKDSPTSRSPLSMTAPYASGLRMACSGLNYVLEGEQE
jgi:hypothetical protein